MQKESVDLRDRDCSAGDGDDGGLLSNDVQNSLEFYRIDFLGVEPS